MLTGQQKTRALNCPGNSEMNRDRAIYDFIAVLARRQDGMAAISWLDATKVAWIFSMAIPPL
jgi:hypothetical protein